MKEESMKLLKSMLKERLLQRQRLDAEIEWIEKQIEKEREQ